jgi:hypothetical protein
VNSIEAIDYAIRRLLRGRQATAHYNLAELDDAIETLRALREVLADNERATAEALRPGRLS